MTALRAAAAALACACVGLTAFDPARAGDEGVEPLVINGCNIWPRTRCRGADLRHADLSAKNLAGADFSGANLARADLRAANIAGSFLSCSIPIAPDSSSGRRLYPGNTNRNDSANGSSLFVPHTRLCVGRFRVQP